HSVDYNAFIRRVHFSFDQIPFDSQTLASLRKHIPHPTFINDPNLGLRAHIRVALTWTLCAPHLEQLRSMDMPLSHTSLYLAVVDRFQSLTSVRFVFDASCASVSLPTLVAPYLADWAPPGGVAAYSGSLEERLDRAYESMACFVEEHMQLFRGPQIRQVTCPESETNPCPKTIRARVIDMLPPLDRPRQLHAGNWRQLVRHFDATSLERVTKVVTPRGWQWHRDMMQIGEIWARCRALKELELWPSRIPVSFQWAVQEKEERQRGGFGQPKDLVPLKSAIIYQSHCEDLFETANLMVGFSSTLQKLIYDNSYDSRAVDHGSMVVKYIKVGSQGATMPVLTTLAFTTNYHRFLLDPLLLAQCPALHSVRICSDRATFDPVARFWSEPLRLPKLVHVALRGDGALGFNMETFGSSPLVRSIDLAMCEVSKVHDGPGYSYPGVSNSPHHWSWIWDLPRLTSLKLGPGFGTLFEFRMLDKCPALVTLRLSVYGPDSAPEGRRVMESDLSSSSSDLSASGYITCSHLKFLTLLGPWVLSPRVLRLLVVEVLPALVRVVMTDCRGHGVTDWVEATQNSRTLRYATTNLATSCADEIVDLGLSVLRRVYRPLASLMATYQRQGADAVADTINYKFTGVDPKAMPCPLREK
ncbi:hypothetical protein BGZ81_001129, partial [Podila clonocystis]